MLALWIMLFATVSEAAAQTPAFVASIKPGDPVPQSAFIAQPSPDTFATENVPLRAIIAAAYNVTLLQLSASPSVTKQIAATWTIAAKAETPLNADQKNAMLRAMLADRFNLKVHRESKEDSVFFLNPAKKGLLLTPVECAVHCANTAASFRPGLRVWTGDSITMNVLTNYLSNFLRRSVIDRTGFKSQFAIHLEWARDETSDGPSLFTALEEQAGLKLDSGKGPVDVLVIDSVGQPGEN
jgi:uncharacterized protein (TIGR03435 family)